MAYNKTSEERKWKAAPDGQGRLSGRAQIPGTSG